MILKLEIVAKKSDIDMIPTSYQENPSLVSQLSKRNLDIGDIGTFIITLASTHAVKEIFAIIKAQVSKNKIIKIKHKETEIELENTNPDEIIPLLQELEDTLNCEFED